MWGGPRPSLGVQIGPSGTGKNVPPGVGLCVDRTLDSPEDRGNRLPFVQQNRLIQAP